MRLQISYEELEDAVIEWAHDRDLLSQDPRMQLLKTTEELGELISASLKGRTMDELDAIGDVLVTLIIYCAIKGYDPVHCLALAYNEISDRKGETKDGVFIRAE